MYATYTRSLSLTFSKSPLRVHPHRIASRRPRVQHRHFLRHQCISNLVTPVLSFHVLHCQLFITSLVRPVSISAPEEVVSMCVESQGSCRQCWWHLCSRVTAIMSSCQDACGAPTPVKVATIWSVEVVSQRLPPHDGRSVRGKASRSRTTTLTLYAVDHRHRLLNDMLVLTGMIEPLPHVQ